MEAAATAAAAAAALDYYWVGLWCENITSWVKITEHQQIVFKAVEKTRMQEQVQPQHSTSKPPPQPPHNNNQTERKTRCLPQHLCHCKSSKKQKVRTHHEIDVVFGNELNNNNNNKK